MDFHIFFEQFINGITQGSVYALLALGFTMIFGTLRMVTFAHGEVYMIGAYVGFEMIRLLYPSFLLGLTAALIATALLGIMDIPLPNIFGYEIETRVQYYYLIFFLVLLTIVSMHRLMTCRFGRALVSIRENELAAEAMGVHTTRYKTQAFVLVR